MSDRTAHVTRRVGVVAGHIAAYMLLWVGLTLLIAAVCIRYFWGEISVNQMLMNLVTVEFDGGGGAIVWVGVLGVGVAPVLITVGIALWQFLLSRERRRAGTGAVSRPRRSPWISRTISSALVAAVVVGGTTAFANAVGMQHYIEAVRSEYNLGDYYVAPDVTSSQQKRNLVLIYLESGEATLANDQHFEKDAFATLKDATSEADGWQSVEDFQQYEGGNWTMAGFVSTQCGIPLKGMGSPADSGSAPPVEDDGDTFLGGVTCLGDVLAEHDYTNVFLGGANSSFAGKETFLRNHGYSEVKGLDDWRAAGEPEESFRSDWGLSDERLLAQAKDHLDELHAESERTGKPFNLSLLTLDTHEPVRVYDYCTVDTEEVVTSVFACSTTLVAEFVDHLEEQGHLEDTAVVIMGDHLKHMSAGDAFHDQLDDHTNRTIFNRIWVPGADTSSALRPGVDQLNMFPTILEAVGLPPEGRQAGVGVSAFAPAVPEDSAQALEPGVYTDLLNSLSPQFYGRAWAGEVTGR